MDTINQTSNTRTSVVVAIFFVTIISLIAESHLFIPLVYDQFSNYNIPTSLTEERALDVAKAFQKVIPTYWGFHLAENAGSLETIEILASLLYISIAAIIVYIAGDRIYKRVDL